MYQVFVKVSILSSYMHPKGVEMNPAVQNMRKMIQKLNILGYMAENRKRTQNNCFELTFLHLEMGVSGDVHPITKDLSSDEFKALLDEMVVEGLLFDNSTDGVEHPHYPAYYLIQEVYDEILALHPGLNPKPAQNQQSIRRGQNAFLMASGY